MKEFTAARRHIDVSVGESVRILRELQELSQNDLADISGIPQSTTSAIENDRVSPGVERAKTLDARRRGRSTDKTSASQSESLSWSST